MDNTVNLKNAAIVKTSPTSFGITVPKAFIDNGQLRHGDIVDVEITIIEKEESA